MEIGSRFTYIDSSTRGGRTLAAGGRQDYRDAMSANSTTVQVAFYVHHRVTAGSVTICTTRRLGLNHATTGNV